MVRVNRSKTLRSLLGNTLMALVMVGALAIPVLQAQSGGGQTQSQPPANSQPAQDIPDAPPTVQPPPPKPALPATVPPPPGKANEPIPFPGDAPKQPDQQQSDQQVPDQDKP